MPKFLITAEVNCATLEEAQRVASERLGYDEDYGFAYQFGEDKVVPVYANVKADISYTDSDTPMPFIETQLGAVGVGIVRTGTNGAVVVNIEPVTEDEVKVIVVTHGRDEVTTLRFNEK